MRQQQHVWLVCMLRKCIYIQCTVCILCMYVAAGESWRDDEYSISIADHLSGALYHIRRDHAQAAAGRLGP